MRLLLPLLLLTMPIQAEEAPQQLPYCEEVRAVMLEALQEDSIQLTYVDVERIYQRCKESGL